jgi:hypothetical protein
MTRLRSVDSADYCGAGDEEQSLTTGDRLSADKEHGQFGEITKTSDAQFI